MRAAGAEGFAQLASQPREAGRAKGGMELKAVWNWFWSEVLRRRACWDAESLMLG